MIKILKNGRYVQPTQEDLDNAVSAVLNTTIEVEVSKQIKLIESCLKS